jgi:hypothetical protein
VNHASNDQSTIYVGTEPKGSPQEIRKALLFAFLTFGLGAGLDKVFAFPAFKGFELVGW